MFIIVNTDTKLLYNIDCCKLLSIVPILLINMDLIKIKKIKGKQNKKKWRKNIDVSELMDQI